MLLSRRQIKKAVKIFAKLAELNKNKKFDEEKRLNQKHAILLAKLKDHKDKHAAWFY